MNNKRLVLFTLLVLMYTLSYSQTVKDGLVGYYKLNNNLIDKSINNIEGSGFDLSEFDGVDGLQDGSYQFNGLSSYVDLTIDNRNISSVVSLSAWVRTTENYRQFVVSKYLSTEDRGYFLAVDGGNALIGGRNGCDEFNQCVSSVKIDDGEWHHIVGIFDEGTFQIWVDCELENLIATPCFVDLACSDPLTIGSWFEGTSAGNQRNFSGSIDEVRIYNRKLTFSEIGTLCNISFITAIEETENSAMINLYPNPVNNILNIELENINEKISYTIVDLKGINVAQGKVKRQLDLDNIESGYYTILFRKKGKLLGSKRFFVN